MDFKQLPGDIFEPRRIARRASVLVRAVLPPNFSDAKWRRVTWPGCPVCARGGSVCHCARPAFWLPAIPKATWGRLPMSLRCLGALYLDTETGMAHCEGCADKTPFSESVFGCYGCGATFRGGELWEGMEAELAMARTWPWMRAVKARVSQEITGCGFHARRLAKTDGTPPCGCPAALYRLDGKTDICANCLRRWPAGCLVPQD